MYCPSCASSIEPGQTVCPLCGSAIAIAAPLPPPNPPPAPAPAAGRPKTLRSGMALLVVSLAATVFYFLINLGRYALPFRYSAQTVAFMLIWAVLLVLAWQRQRWTRVVMIALIVWSLGNLGYGILRQSVPFEVLLAAYATPLLIQVLRAAGVALLFTPDARRWFSVRSDS